MVIQAPEDKHFIFVYGSLKEGFGNHGCLQGADKVAEGITYEPEFCMKSLGGFPAVYHVGPEGFPDAPAESIWGEVYEGDSLVLARCDRLEGHPHFYCRKKHLIKDVGGTVIEAWIYLLPIRDMDRFSKRVGDVRVERVDLDHRRVANWLPYQHQWY